MNKLSYFVCIAMLFGCNKAIEPQNSTNNNSQNIIKVNDKLFGCQLKFKQTTCNEKDCGGLVLIEEDSQATFDNKNRPVLIVPKGGTAINNIKFLEKLTYNDLFFGYDETSYIFQQLITFDNLTLEISYDDDKNIIQEIYKQNNVIKFQRKSEFNSSGKVTQTTFTNKVVKYEYSGDKISTRKTYLNNNLESEVKWEYDGDIPISMKEVANGNEIYTISITLNNAKKPIRYLRQKMKSMMGKCNLVPVL